MSDPYQKYTPNDDGYTTENRRKRNRDDSDDGEERERDSKRTNSTHSPLLKLLVPNYAAGAIIGKGGSNINELQNKYGAKIRLSPSGEFYPGTEERIVIMTGEVSQIIDLNNYIIDKVHVDSTEGHGSRFRDEERGQKIKIVLPNATAGLVIGRGGSTIKSLQEETKAKIMISSRDEAKVQGERVLTITGNTEQRIEAARQVISKIASDAENMANKNLTYSNSSSMRNSGGVGGATNYGVDFSQPGIPSNLSALSSMLGGLQQQNHKSSSQSFLQSLSQNPLAALQQSGLGQLLMSGASSGFGGFGGSNQMIQGFGQTFGDVANNIKTTVSIQMEIPDILVGAILGKQGKTIHEFIQFSGAKIQFSAKNDYAPGTTDRILSIQGDLNQTQIAYFLVNQKIMQAENELASGLQNR